MKSPHAVLAFLLAATASLSCQAAPAAWPTVPADSEEGFPPIARLVLADGSAHAGELGAFSYRDASASAPWLPATGLARLSVPEGAQLAVALLPGDSFAAWNARYAAAADTQADVILPLGAGGRVDGEGRLDQATFPAPPTGEWVIEVHLVFPDGDGDAAFYWYVALP